MRLHLPKQPGEVTPEWLTQVLHARGTLDHARVAGLEFETIGTFSSELWRLHLYYDGVEGNAPATLILKRPSTEAYNRPHSGFANEVRFYRDIAQRVSVRTPQLYFGSVDDATGEAILLLEDVRGLAPIDWDTGVTDDHAQLALEALAALHAAWWEQVDSLNELPHLGDPAFRSQMAEAYDRGWRASRDYFKAHYGKPFVTIGDALLGHVETALAQMAAPATLLHGDAHFENIVIASHNNREEVMFMDWADARRGLASFDIAVFAVQSYPTPVRRLKEEALVKAHAELVRAAGVHDWPDPWLGYRRGMLNWVIHMMQNAALRPGDASSFVIDRYVAAAVDLRLGDLIC